MINKDSIYSLLRSFLGSFQFFVISVLVIQFTSITNWGNFISIYLVWSVCVLLINSGTKDFLVKTISKNPPQLYTVLSQSTSLRLILSIVPSVIVLVWYNNAVAVKLLMVFAIYLRVFTSSIEGLIVFQKAFKQSFYTELVAFGAICMLIFLGFQINQLSPVYILFSICFVDILKLVIYEFIFSLFKQLSLSFNSFNKSIRELVPFIGIGVIGLIMNKADLYLMGVFFSEHETIGHYQIINTLSNILIVSVSSFLLVRNKTMYRIPLQRFNKLQTVYLYYVFAFLTVACVAFYNLAPFLFHLRLPVYQLGMVLLTVLIYSKYSFDIFLNLRLDRVVVVNKVLAISAVANVLFGLMLIPLFKINGALVSVLLANVAALIGFKLNLQPPIHQNQ